MDHNLTKEQVDEYIDKIQDSALKMGSLSKAVNAVTYCLLLSEHQRDSTSEQVEEEKLPMLSDISLLTSADLLSVIEDYSDIIIDSSNRLSSYICNKEEGG